MLSRANRSSGILEPALDALTAHVAVLDESGTILRVNRAWQRFAVANGATPGSEGPGVNYLDVCDAAGTGDEDGAHARAVADGIRRVIGREISEFELEYPCHSPTAQRWFLVRVVDSMTDPRLILVIHENITARKVSESVVKERVVAQSIMKRVLRAFGRGSAAFAQKRRLGRDIARESGVGTLVGFVDAFTALGLGPIQLVSAVSGRYTFRGTDLVERHPHSAVATCHVTLGYLEGAVAAITGESTLGAETECQSQGHPHCKFVVQTRPQ